MTSLLDANVLIALFDPAHLHNRAAHDWLTKNRNHGWASCPLTQNACVRILSQPAYPGNLTVAEAARRLERALSAEDHEFWDDSISFTDCSRFSHSSILSSKHLTDLYLLALAMEHGGRLVTFDQNIPAQSVVGAKSENLIVLQTSTRR